MGQFTERVLEGELDRELVLDASCGNSDKVGWAADRVKVSNKSLRYSNNHGQAVVLEKKSFYGQRLEIKCEWIERKIEQCSLGHYHEIKKDVKRSEHVTILWDQVDSLIEWLQLGSYSEVTRRKDPRDAVLAEMQEFLLAVEAASPALKASSQKLRNKIRNVN